jgi:hemerythrin-like domain-containing protein
VKRKAFSVREGKKNKNYSIILFNDAYLYLCLKRIDAENPRLCPYIKELINNDDFNNIDTNDIKIDDNEDETDEKNISNNNNKQETKYILPYNKIDINILKNDVLNH